MALSNEQKIGKALERWAAERNFILEHPEMVRIRRNMSHKARIQRMLDTTVRKTFHENAWGARHCAAWLEPQPVEEPIVRMIEAAALYADRHQARFESKVGEDGVLGPSWAEIVNSIRNLLNGECGRLDCGTLDGLLLDMLHSEGFEE